MTPATYTNLTMLSTKVFSTMQNGVNVDEFARVVLVKDTHQKMFPSIDVSNVERKGTCNSTSVCSTSTRSPMDYIQWYVRSVKKGKTKMKQRFA